jgi:hypothetical protein
VAVTDLSVSSSAHGAGERALGEENLDRWARTETTVPGWWGQRTPGPTGNDGRGGRARLAWRNAAREGEILFLFPQIIVIVQYVSNAEGKYNKKGSIRVFTKVTSITIHHLSSYKIYKSCRVAIVHVAEHNPPIKNKRRTRNLFSWATSNGNKLSSYLLA